MLMSNELRSTTSLNHIYRCYGLWMVMYHAWRPCHYYAGGQEVQVSVCITLVSHKRSKQEREVNERRIIMYVSGWRSLHVFDINLMFPIASAQSEVIFL